jgi:hypothetical protein
VHNSFKRNIHKVYVAYFNVIFQHRNGCAEDNHENLSLSTGYHWNQGPSACRGVANIPPDACGGADDKY